jgi:hypothetical protein
MSDVLTITIAGLPTIIDLVAMNATLDQVTPFNKGGVPELHFSRLLGPLEPAPPSILPALPDAWSGKSCSLTMLSGTLVFTGDIVGYVDRYMDSYGWLREYRALGLLQRANYIPMTDSQTLTDTATYNLPGDDPNFIGARAGLTVGAIVEAVLNMSQNATALAAAGIGNYTSAGPPPSGLPTVTMNDLAGLTVIPPWRVVIGGERILQALEALVVSCHPNHFLHVDPLGNIRFLDTRTFTPNTLTLGADPRLMMPTLTRDYSDCYSQVEIRGNTLVQGVSLQTQPWPGSSSSDGGLQEDFAWGSLSNAAAKAAWVPADWSQPNQSGAPYDLGTCTCPSTTTVTVTSSDPAMEWGVDALSQANLLGTVILYADVITGVEQLWQARIVSNTALTPGGSSILTLDVVLPALTYNAYKIYALTAGENVVGRKYKVSNAAIGAAMQLYFPYPFAYVNSSGDAASLTSTPIGTVMWGAFGGTTPPYNTGMDGVTIDAVNGIIYLDKPSQVVVNGLNTPTQWPANVEVFVPVAIGTLSAFAPSSSTYSGTLDTVEGIHRTKTITVLDWRDIGNQANMDLFASEFLDSVQDVVVEGVVPYAGLLSTFITPGQAISIAGTSGATPYITGWEALALPVCSVTIRFNSGPYSTSYEMGLMVTNRRGRYSFANFLKPNVQGAQFGGSSVFGPGLTSSIDASAGYQKTSDEMGAKVDRVSSGQGTPAEARELSGQPEQVQGGGGFNVIDQPPNAPMSTLPDAGITPAMADPGTGGFNAAGMGTPPSQRAMIRQERAQTQNQQDAINAAAGMSSANPAAGAGMGAD